MNAPQRTVAETRRSRWPGWIWGVPIAALLVVGWLGLRAFARGGEKVVVTFDTAQGVKAGDTKVRLKGVEVGEVSGVVLDKDGRHVQLTLTLDDKVDDHLRAGTRFWLVGAKPSLSDLASLKAALAGAEIGMEPGPGARADHFVGLDREPAIPLGTPGTAFVLTTDKLGAPGEGSSIYYAGQEVGKITGTRFKGAHAFELAAFVRAPYDGLVTSATHFWNASPVQVSTSGGGLRAELVSPAALLAGAVAFDTPSQAAPAPASAAESRFPLYADHQAAEQAPIGAQIAYRLRFDGAVGGLDPGAAVKLRGFRVGEVTGVALAYDARTGALETPVEIELEPARLHIEGVDATTAEDWRPIVDAMLRRFIAKGLRASLAQDPPLIGARGIALEFANDRRPGALQPGADLPEIPTASSGDLASIKDDVHGITTRIRHLVSSPQVSDSLKHLDRTLAQLDRSMREVGPQLGPLVGQLRKTADEADRTVAAANRIVGGAAANPDSDLPGALHQLTETARSIRALADYLERHPEALIEGKPESER